MFRAYQIKSAKHICLLTLPPQATSLSMVTVSFTFPVIKKHGTTDITASYYTELQVLHHSAKMTPKVVCGGNIVTAERYFCTPESEDIDTFPRITGC